ncbi:hypothetical protein M0R04_12000 [Candidatus Dojkabacteria bacterium]|jgi:hypothetical protein|nr:hypothetical protein [Candidatus Dojkabacteria bacterium]
MDNKKTKDRRYRKVNYTFRCIECDKIKTEKVSYTQRHNKRYCKDCNPVKMWFKRNPEYMSNYMKSYDKLSQCSHDKIKKTTNDK